MCDSGSLGCHKPEHLFLLAWQSKSCLRDDNIAVVELVWASLIKPYTCETNFVCGYDIVYSYL